MAQRHNFLAIDLGATSGRGVLATFETGADGGRKYLTFREIYRFHNSYEERGGRYFWNIQALLGHCLAAISAALDALAAEGGRQSAERRTLDPIGIDTGRGSNDAKGQEGRTLDSIGGDNNTREQQKTGTEGRTLDSIGIDTWGVDFGLLGGDGRLLTDPRAYRDPYTQGVQQKVFDIIPREEVYGITGIQVMDFNSLFQLKAQKDENYAPLASAKALLFMPDLLSYLLTGNAVCEYTDASTSQMMNQSSREFDKSLLERLGIDSDILLPIVQPGVTVGKLKKEFGLGEIPVVAVAGHDTASAIAAVPAENEHFAYLSSGTWSLMGIETSAPIISDESCRLNFTNEGGIEGTTRFLKNITGMWLLEQCRKVWAEEGREYSYAQLQAMALSAKDYAQTVDPDDPRLANPHDMEAAIKSIVREKARGCEPSSRAETVSCIYHSLVKRYVEVLDMLQGFAPFEIDCLHVIGGGSRNELLNQWTADAIGRPVIAGPSEATSIGNVMMQAKAAGLVADRWEFRRIVRDAFKVRIYTPSEALVEAVSDRLPGVGLDPQVEVVSDRLPGAGLEPLVEAVSDRLPGAGFEPQVEAGSNRLPGAGFEPQVEAGSDRLPGAGLEPQIEAGAERLKGPSEGGG